MGSERWIPLGYSVCSLLVAVVLANKGWNQHRGDTDQPNSGRDDYWNQPHKKVTIPPVITIQPPQELGFKPKGRVDLECVASGIPAPRYVWKVNDTELQIGTRWNRVDTNTGSIYLDDASDLDKGSYQCFVDNGHGTAISIKTQLKVAQLLPFPNTNIQPKRHKVNVGDKLTLNCTPPYSYPKDQTNVFWSWTKEGSRASAGIIPVVATPRVGWDESGNLHFANIIEKDLLKYSCTVKNSDVRSYIQGEDSIIEPKKVLRTRNKAPQKMYHTPTPKVVLVKQEALLKCIFSGLPTPTVSWRRIGEPMPSSAEFLDFGRELLIPEAEVEDAGEYECTGENSEGTVSLTVVLNVQSAPYFTEKPKNVNSSDSESASFTCRAGGDPQPVIKWFIDGVPLENVRKAVNRVLTADGLSINYTNLTKDDAQVLQCMANNTHGYVLENAYLNVLALPPEWRSPPEDAVRAEGQSVEFKCETFAAPRAKVTWTLDGQPLQGSRFSVDQLTGTLSIRDIDLDEDAGVYKCIATNKFGELPGEATLSTRKATVVSQKPKDERVEKGTDTTFECDATVDPAETDNLVIEWKKNGEYIDYEREPNINKNLNTNALIITNAQVDDTATYTCVAKTSVDETEASAELVVFSVPDAPTNVVTKTCEARTGSIMWDKPSPNNSPILRYYIEMKTGFEDKWYRVKDRNGQQELTVSSNFNAPVKISLSPYVNYTFRVIAENGIGLSEPSDPTGSVCKTPAANPEKNPQNVRDESKKPGEFFIKWDTMAKMDHNGPGFYYIVSYYEGRLNQVRPPWVHVNVTHIEGRGELKIEDRAPFTPFVFKVRAANAFGVSLKKARKHFGYSGESEPKVSPKGFRVDEEEPSNGTAATFRWEKIDCSPENVGGFFKGYKVEFWIADQYEDTRKTSEIVLQEYPNDVLQCDKRSYSKRQADTPVVKGHVTNLYPYSNLVAHVMVMNRYYDGPPSVKYEWLTPEGLPGPVGEFDVTQPASHHVEVAWDEPEEVNGNLKGYEIEYVPFDEDGNLDPSRSSTETIDDPTQTVAKLKDLDPDTKYRICIYAKTGAGRGEKKCTETKTRVNQPPSKPQFFGKPLGESEMNITWEESRASENPGATFYVNYRPTGDDGDWNTTDSQEYKYWRNISGLLPAGRYDVYVTAVSGNGVTETDSDTKEVLLGARAAKVEEVTTAGWFIGIMVVLALLLLILLIVCLIKRNRGGKYPVYEKEKLRGHDPDEDEEGGFNEYQRPPEDDDDDIKKSQPSLADEKEPLESETDSMAEYGDVDPGKFNEDGSFIGQYGGNKREGNYTGEPDATSPSAMSTFV
ncbi:unnamed protein product [Owenia fusiformis]|uniref:Uncharacterized protein n=1 Tax=Owenia fusiformis TaxID=6347 RepID=A0A8J1T8V5_OWEFU|nr:unnamed protein product [Owenia fusiformis]